MNPFWQAYLEAHGAIIHEGRVISFGDPASEMESTRSATVLSDLSHFGLIHFLGDDAQPFLQGQLSCDVRQVDCSAASYGSYCTSKGRMLASFLIWRASKNDGGGYLMQLPAVLQAGIQKRLSMYVLRAKVKLNDGGDNLIRMGVAGCRAAALIQDVLGEIPAEPLGVIHRLHATIICLAEDRFEIAVQPEQVTEVWEGLSRNALPVGASCWDWLEVKAGIPVIMPETQEQFVPQMVNLDAIGGISFQKGCYPGQEIIARTRYLGKVKRRMYLAHIKPEAGETVIAAGDELFSADMGEQSSGMVVNAAASPNGGADLLAVAQTSSVEAGEIHWKSLEGPVLKIMPLPYVVSQ
jgi:folate-binding protein YgfZ